MAYNSDGQLSTVTDSLAQLTQYNYDPNKRLSSIHIAGKQLNRFGYDNIGRVTLSENLHGQQTQYAYNNLNSFLTITLPNGEKIERGYGTCPRLVTKEILPGNRVNQYQYNANKQLTTFTNASGALIRLDYNKNGNTTQLADNNKTVFKLNDVGQLIEKIYADNSKATVVLDKGTVNSVTNARGKTITYTYNTNKLLEKVTYSDGTHQVLYVYNAKGEITSITDGQGTHSYTYQTNGALKSYDSPLTNDLIELNYDLQSRLQKIKLNSVEHSNYEYDVLGRIKSIDAQGKLFNWTFDDEYTVSIRPTVTSTRPNGISLVNTLNEAGQVSSRNYQHATEPQAAYSYTYNELGLVSSVNSSREELIDTNGMGVNRHNKLNQLVKSSLYAEDFSYDLDGNMTGGYLPTGERFTATYDINNRLTTIGFTRSSVNIIESFDYFFSGLLARSRVTENSQITKDIKYLRLGLTELQERNAADTVIATNWWHPDAPGGVGGLLRRNENSTDYYANYDHNGNIIQVTNTSGQVVADLFYATFGKTLQGDNPIPFGFSTKRNDFASGLIYYGQRFYLPHLGRWLNRDPIGEQDDLNLYAMVAGDPINKIDPNGELALVGALFSGGLDLALQLAQNGGVFGCIDWGQVAISSALGAVGAVGFDKALKGFKALKSAANPKVRAVAKRGTTVIGRVKDLQNLKKGEQSLLNRLPNKGSAKANWKQNAGVIREEISKGKPIRDASPGDKRGQFLNAERNLLESRGWIFDKSSSFWNPPKL